MNFIRPRSNDVFNVSHPKGLIFLARLRIDLDHLREHKFKHSFLDTLNPICTCGFDIETLNHFFLQCPRFTNERQNLLLKIEKNIPAISKKPTLVLHQYFFMTIRVFPLNLTPTYSIYLLTAYYPQKGLNLISLQRLHSYLRSSKF